VNPKILIGVETTYESKELFNYGVNMTIKNFLNLNIKELINDNKFMNYSNDLTLLIKDNFDIFKIKNIIFNEEKLKGGFISDVIDFKIESAYRDYSLILKYENINDNDLSNMARRLHLYEREYYFYTEISKYVDINIKTPKFYGLLRDKNNNDIGIVLENLFKNNFKINLNLNHESIDITLKIIDKMALLHSKFWNKNLKELFPKLKNSCDDIFYPFLCNFVNEKKDLFIRKWDKILNNEQIIAFNKIILNFEKIQRHFSENNNLTFIHGDIKSPNLFYDTKNGYEPYFIDWQHCSIGKGCQDLIFFMIESFDISNLKNTFNLAKEYYYKKLIEYGITSYTYLDYEKDILYSLYYIPIFTSVWFGTISQDELIDKNFPYFLITKLFYLIDYVSDNKNLL